MKAKNWIVFASVCAFCIAFLYQNFYKAFPSVSIPIVEDRDFIMKNSKEMLKEYSLCPSFFNENNEIESDVMSAMHFNIDSESQKFIEWTTNSTYYQKLISDKTYSFYQWHVRFFKEKDECETWIFFSSELEPLGFSNHLPETLSLERNSIEPAEGRGLCVEEAERFFPGFEEDGYEYATYSTDIQPSQRLDQYWTFEKNFGKLAILIEKEDYSFDATDNIGVDPSKLSENDLKIEIQMQVSGNRVNSIIKQLRVPEKFQIDYQMMRAFNESLASLSVIFFGFVCVLMIFYTLFYLFKKDLFSLYSKETRRSFVYAFVMGLLLCLYNINQFPLEWLNYPTMISKNMFFMKYINNEVRVFVFNGLFFVLIFIVAESLNRMTFPKHGQLFSWIGNLRYVPFSDICICYGVVLMDLAYVTLFYRVLTSPMFGWWIPTEPNLDPNHFTHYQPWITAAISSIHAGLMEELIFRVIPLSFFYFRSSSKAWKYTGMIFQIVIFSAAHANYPASPFYARLVELLIPSFIFGYLFIKKGFWAGVLVHYLYDLFWFSSAIWFSENPYKWVYRGVLITFFLMPMILWGISSFIYPKAKKFRTNEDLMKEYEEQKKRKEQKRKSGQNDNYDDIDDPHSSLKLSFKRFSSQFSWVRITILLLCMSALFYYVMVVAQPSPLLSKLNLHREESFSNAVEKFRSKIAKSKSDRSKAKDWRCFSIIVSKLGAPDHVYMLYSLYNIAEEKGLDEKETIDYVMGGYKHMIDEGYLRTFSHVMRCYEFGDIEEYQFESFSGAVQKMIHIIPENVRIKSLDKLSAIEHANMNLRFFMNEHPSIKDEELLEKYPILSVQNDQKLHRTDWAVYYNVSFFKRFSVHLNGDEVVALNKFVFVPDEFTRSQLARKEVIQLFASFLNILVVLWYIFMAVFCVVFMVKEFTSSRSLFYSSLFSISSFLFVIMISRSINNFPSVSFHFVPSNPASLQVLQNSVFIFIVVFFSVCLISSLFYYAWKYIMRRERGERKDKMNQVKRMAVGLIEALFELVFTSNHLALIACLWIFKNLLGYKDLKWIDIPLITVDPSDLSAYVPMVSIILSIVVSSVWISSVELFSIIFLYSKFPFFGSLLFSLLTSVGFMDFHLVNEYYYIVYMFFIFVIWRGIVSYFTFYMFDRNDLRHILYKNGFALIIKTLILELYSKEIIPFKIYEYVLMGVLAILLLFVFEKLLDLAFSSLLNATRSPGPVENKKDSPKKSPNKKKKRKRN